MPEAVIRVGIVGTESTGKSALAEALANHFDEPFAAEFVREFWDLRAGRIDPADLSTIARGQIVSEETAALRARRIVFCDTTLLMNVRWADDLYAGCIPAWVRTAADVRAPRYALHLLCEPDLPWANDPQRTYADETEWRASAERVRQMVIERDLPMVSIGGRGEARLALAIKAVQAVVAGDGG